MDVTARGQERTSFEVPALHGSMGSPNSYLRGAISPFFSDSYL